jgi:hypothetical protein
LPVGWPLGKEEEESSSYEGMSARSSIWMAVETVCSALAQLRSAGEIDSQVLVISLIDGRKGRRFHFGYDGKDHLSWFSAVQSECAHVEKVDQHG